MTKVVLDFSAALCWCFEDEATSASDRLLAYVGVCGAVVPALWRFEIANTLLQAERRRRIPEGGANRELERLAKVPVDLDRESIFAVWGMVVEIARSDKLTAYDASYLELALRLRMPLATKDEALVAAARGRGAEIIPLLDS